MEQNKTGKYFKYAIGEIILVMVGILLALQVNNWNEQGKTKQKETIVLNDILNSISEDFNSFDNMRRRLNIKKNAIDSLFKYAFAKQTINDSHFSKFFYPMKTDVIIRFDNGPFEALKSAGLEIIGNDTLRTVINKTYTVTLPVLRTFTENISAANNPEIERREYKIMKLNPIQLDNGTKLFAVYPKVENIINNEDFLWILKLERQKYFVFSNRLRQIRTKLTELKTSIENELNK